ncbi:enoyl-CoA hydratase-related protein [Actibacterium sp. MT2.3-13A]|uniref:enoyl-CoA hydratase-related protein n=1 Tax=Actibacterium sp. MT2.3-13A TaxID=2828332 RepID=UPI001BA94754|nr:enoyl-CoA hydratase-related protein [Actibacterium sp. MT2.3-13A]
MSGPVALSVAADGIARIAVDNPPVNALSHPVRRALWDAVEAAEADRAVRLILLAAEGRTFPAGADINEFHAKPQDLWLPDLCDRIEACAKPVVAVLHGTALGGGFELALAAHYRLAAEDAQVGLPEVTLGLLPGAGGTQRLPRLAGGAAALEIMLGGRPVDAAQAQRLGLLDRVVRGDLSEAARAYARELLAADAGPRRTRDSRAGLRDTRAYMAAIRHHRAWLSDAPVPAPEKIVDCVEAALLLPFETGLAFERAAFEDCVTSDASHALRHAFLAERRAAKIPGRGSAAPRPVQRLGLAGGDPGLAAAALEAGLAVTLIAPDPEAATAEVAGHCAGVSAQGIPGDEAQVARLARLSATSDPAALAGADLVIAGRAQAGEALAHLSPEAVLAVAGAAAARGGGRVAGLYLPPAAEGGRLAEVLVAPETSPETAATLFAALRRLGRVALRCAGGPVGPAMSAAMLRAAGDMLLRGADPYRIDDALRGFGFALGPYERLDRDGQAAQAGALGVALARRGWTGRGAGRGVYRYDREAEPRVEDPEVLALLRALQAEGGRPQRSLSGDEIVQRMMAAAANAGAKLVDAGVVLRPSDVDVAMMLGQGFPRWRGGPMMLADQTGLLAVKRTLDILSEENPAFWAPAPLFAELIKNGRRFADLNGG